LSAPAAAAGLAGSDEISRAAKITSFAAFSPKLKCC